MAKYSLEELVDEVLLEGMPKALSRLRTKLSLEKAEELGVILNRHGMAVEPFDFPGTYNVWQGSNANGIPYKIVATKQFIQALAATAGVDYRTVEGFRTILPRITADNLQHLPINMWGTTLSGMLRTAYANSPSGAVLDLIEHDSELVAIRKAGIQPYDFTKAPEGAWKDEHGQPTPAAREATKQFIQALAATAGVDYRTVEGFRTILPKLTEKNFQHYIINCWGTTLNGMLSKAYANSPFVAVLDLVRSEPDLKCVREKMGDALIRDITGGNSRRNS